MRSLFPDKGGKLGIQITGCIRKCRKDKDFFVACLPVAIDGVSHFSRYQLPQMLQLAVVAGRYLPHQRQKPRKAALIRGKVLLPGKRIHVRQIDADLASGDSRIRKTCQLFILFPGISVPFSGKTGFAVLAEGADPFQRLFAVLQQRPQGQAEGFHGTFQPLEEVRGHQRLQAALTVRLTQHLFSSQTGIVHRLIFGDTAWQQIVQRRVHRQLQLGKFLKDRIEVRDVRPGREGATVGQGLEALRERTDIAGIIKGLDVLAGTGDGHAVQQLEKVIVQAIQNGL